MGLNCSLKLSTSTPRGYADRLSVVRTTEYVAIDQSSDRVTATFFFLTLPGQVGRMTPSAVGGQGQTAVSQSTDLLGHEDTGQKAAAGVSARASGSLAGRP